MIAHTGQKVAPARRGGQTHFLFLCEEKENGFGCQKKKNGAIIVAPSSSSRRPGKTGLQEEDAATGRHDVVRRRCVAFLLLTPRPPLGTMTRRSFSLAFTFHHSPHPFHFSTFELQKTNSPGLHSGRVFVWLKRLRERLKTAFQSWLAEAATAVTIGELLYSRHGVAPPSGGIFHEQSCQSGPPSNRNGGQQS